MTAREPTVFVLDDEAAMHRSLENLMRPVGFRVEIFASRPQVQVPRHLEDSSRPPLLNQSSREE
jgi:FixJ family two-component response regulator